MGNLRPLPRWTGKTRSTRTRTITEPTLCRTGQGILFILIITVHICMEQDSTEITRVPFYILQFVTDACDFLMFERVGRLWLDDHTTRKEDSKQVGKGRGRGGEEEWEKTRGI